MGCSCDLSPSVPSSSWISCISGQVSNGTFAATLVVLPFQAKALMEVSVSRTSLQVVHINYQQKELHILN